MSEDQESRIAQYLYDLITKGDYSGLLVFTSEAGILIKTKWWRKKRIWVVKWEFNKGSYFVFDDLRIYSPLVNEAFEELNKKYKEEKSIKRENELKKIIKEIGLKK